MVMSHTLLLLAPYTAHTITSTPIGPLSLHFHTIPLVERFLPARACRSRGVQWRCSRLMKLQSSISSCITDCASFGTYGSPKMLLGFCARSSCRKRYRNDIFLRRDAE